MMEQEDKENQENIEEEEIEFSLTEDEINEWIISLTELKFHKNNIELDVDDSISLLINFQEDSEEDNIEQKENL